MKIECCNITNNTVTLSFNKLFKQIRFIKMELLNENDTDSLMHSEEFEIKYNKDKCNINLFISSQKFFILLIKEIDHIPVIYSYYLNLNQINNNYDVSNINSSQENILLKAKESLDTLSITSNYINCPIKNENIFAKITKK